jgi:hypothetical protein
VATAPPGSVLQTDGLSIPRGKHGSLSCPVPARLAAERTATATQPSLRPRTERAVDRATPEPRITVRVALLSAKPLTRPACPIQPDVGRLHCHRPERLVRRPPPRPVPADPIPTQARASATGGYEHWLAKDGRVETKEAGRTNGTYETRRTKRDARTRRKKRDVRTGRERSET